jgi:hypothetical protein
VPETLSPVNLLEIRIRARHARHVVAGFARTFPALADVWRQIDDALTDIPALATEITQARAQLATSRLDRANLAAAGRATIAAYLGSEADPLFYLRDELHAQGFGAEMGKA